MLIRVIAKKHTVVGSILLLLVGAGQTLCQSSIDAESRKLVEILSLQPGQVVADVGAGDGEWVVPLSSLVGPSGRVYATEVDPGSIRRITKRISQAGLENTVVVEGDQDHTGLGADSCDAILLRLVYHHFEHPERMQADLLRALRPQGLIAIVDFSPRNSLPRSNVPGCRDGHGVYAETVIEEMTRAGFLLVEHHTSWDDQKNRFLLLFQKPPQPATD